MLANTLIDKLLMRISDSSVLKKIV